MGKGWTVELHAEHLSFLEKRGAISDRGRSTFNRSAVLNRHLQLTREVFRRCNPGESGALPKAMQQLAIRLIPEPWSVKPRELDHLGDLLKGAPGFAAAAKKAGVDPDAFIAAIDALDFVEKAVLLDQALEHQAPAASAAMREGP